MKKKNGASFSDIFKNETKLAAYIIICSTIVVISLSYALFMQIDHNSKNQVVEAGDLTFTYSENTPITSSTNSVCFEPMSLDEANLYASNCSYQFSVTNTGTLKGTYTLVLNKKSDNQANISTLKLILRENGSIINGYPKAISDGMTLLTGDIAVGDTKVYSAQIYVDDSTSFASSESQKVSFEINGTIAVEENEPITTE